METIDKTVRWLAKSQGRDKLCKILQFICRYLCEHFKQKDEFNHFMFENLVESIKEARKLFRIFKSIDQYQGISYLIFYGPEQFSTLLHVLSKSTYFAYWLFSNIAVAAKVKLFNTHYQHYHLIALKIKFFAMVFSLIARFYEVRLNATEKKTPIAHQIIRILSLLLNLLVVCNDSNILGVKWGQRLVSGCGLCSALLSTYILLAQSKETNLGQKEGDDGTGPTEDDD